MTLGAVGDVFAELVKGDLGIGEVRKPGLAFGFVQRNAGRHAKIGRATIQSIVEAEGMKGGHTEWGAPDLRVG